MKNQSRTIKANPELYRVVMDSSGGHRRLPGGSDDFSLQTNRQTLIIIYISSSARKLKRVERQSATAISVLTASACDATEWMGPFHYKCTFVQKVKAILQILTNAKTMQNNSFYFHIQLHNCRCFSCIFDTWVGLRWYERDSNSCPRRISFSILN